MVAAIYELAGLSVGFALRCSVRAGDRVCNACHSRVRDRCRIRVKVAEYVVSVTYIASLLRFLFVFSHFPLFEISRSMGCDQSEKRTCLFSFA